MGRLDELSEQLTEAQRNLLHQLHGSAFWTTVPMPWAEMGLGKLTDELPAFNEGDERTFYRYRLNKAGRALRDMTQAPPRDRA